MAESTQGTDTPATAPINVPDKPALEGLEAALTQRWLKEGTYKFNPDTTREQVYSIDTPPPPTASGSLHVGHMFSFTQTDVQARYMRMTGKNVFYPPMGWDDNGLPTERRVQNYYGVRCDPAIPYKADYTPPAQLPRTSAISTSFRARTSSNCVKNSPLRTRRSSRTCSRPLVCRWTGTSPTAPLTTLRVRCPSVPSSRTSRPVTRTWPKHPHSGCHVPHRCCPSRA